MKYGKLVQANSEAASQLIPKKEKKKENDTAKDPRVTTARKEVEKAYKKFTIKSNIEEQRNLNEKKQNLLKTYSDIREKQLDDMIKKVEEADDRNRHGEG